MKILAIEKDVRPIPPEKRYAVLKDEARAVWDLVERSIIREIYFRKDHSQAIMMLECTDESEARKILGTLPLVQERYIRFDLYPLTPYPGFARLFDTNGDGG
jgi:muconolactone delta-isomerase